MATSPSLTHILFKISSDRAFITQWIYLLCTRGSGLLFSPGR